jgi:hypothetical protein
VAREGAEAHGLPEHGEVFVWCRTGGVRQNGIAGRPERMLGATHYSHFRELIDDR